MKAAVMLLCPLVGPLFVFLSFWLYKLVMSQNMDLSDVVLERKKTEAFIWPETRGGEEYDLHRGCS